MALWAAIRHSKPKWCSTVSPTSHGSSPPTRNITLHFLGSLGPPIIGRILDAFAALVVGVVYVALAWQFTLFSRKMGQAHETTWVLKIPVAPFWYVVAAILWLSVCVQAIVLILEIYHIGKPREASRTDSSEAIL